jgi:HK97 family phage portal protein
MARPSGYLTTENKLDRQKAVEIAERWRTLYGGAENAGKTPVLEMGLNYKALTMNATDAQLIEQLRWTVEDIARVFQIPIFLMGDPSKAMQQSTETLMQIYFSSCLGAHFAILAARINAYFELDPASEYLEFDTDQMFKTNLDARTNAWKNAVQGGLATPNEARAAAFGFNPVPGGDTVFMQQQMVPIDMLGKVALGGGGAPPGGGDQPGGDTPKPPADEPVEENAYSAAVAAALVEEISRRAERWAA